MAVAAPAFGSFGSVRTISNNKWENSLDTGMPKAGIVVIDHYGLGHEYERHCRAITPVVAVIDDTAERRHDCDVIVDQNVGRQPEDYATLCLQPVCHVLAGAGYALLRPAFNEYRDRALRRNRETVRRIVISLGATDTDGMTNVALQALERFGFPETDVFIGNACPHLDDIDSKAKRSSAIKLHVNEDPALAYAEADLAIGTAGVGALERCCLGVPSINLVAADNQRRAAACLSEQGAATMIETSREGAEETIAAHIQTLLDNPSVLSQMSGKAAALCDGKGTERVGKILMEVAGEASD